MKYISYGSNMNLYQMSYRCPNSKVYGNGKVYGYKLVFNYHADIVYTGNDEDYVPVVVWDLEDQTDLACLDRYEGYPLYYDKINVDVVMDDTREVINAMVYVMIDKRKGVYPPSEEYFECIIQGYVDNHIDCEKLYEAVYHCIDKSNITKYNQYNPKKVV